MKKYFNKTKLILAVTALVFTVYSCDDFKKFEPIGANSIADATPPSASFNSSQGEGPDEEWKDYTFANTSASATSYSWDFGNGDTSTEVDGATTYPGEGMYTVTLTATDDLGVSSVFTETIDVVEPEEPMAIVPDILEHSFEDLSLPDGTGDGRDSWRNSDLGGVIQINTSSTVPDGGQAAKFPSDGSRIGYQELVLSPNTDYTITYTYRLENAGGSSTVAILAGGGFTDVASANAAIIESFTGSELSYTTVNIPFNSGANDTVSIFITNQGQEARVDNFLITAQ